MSKKLKFDGLLLHKKYILSGKHAEDLSNITFNYFLCIFLDQTLHILDERSLSKYKFSDFPLLLLKFTKFLMLTFKQEVSFSSKFGSLFSVMRDNSSVVFLAENFICYWQKQHITEQIFRLDTARIKEKQIFRLDTVRIFLKVYKISAKKV